MAFETGLRITGIISAEIKPISVKIAAGRCGDQMEERGNLSVLKQARSLSLSLSLSHLVPFSSENKSRFVLYETLATRLHLLTAM